MKRTTLIDGKKHCSRCGELLPLSAFPRDKSKTSGRASRCQPCTTQASREWRQANLVECQQQARDYYEANRTAKISYSSQYYTEHRDEIRAKLQAKRELEREHFNAAQRERYRSDPGYRQKCIDAAKLHCIRHPERVKLRASRRWAVKSIERRLGKVRLCECGILFPYRTSRQKRCPDCQRQANKESQNKSYKRRCQRGYFHTYYENNKPKVHAATRRWQKNNPDKVAAMQKRTSRKRSIAQKLFNLFQTAAAIQQTITKQNP